MIQRFNFYDVYGYLVPGVVLLALFWLPSGLVSGRWPSVDWSSALVGLVFAYVAGHVLQSLARPALSNTGPQPSDSLLEPDDTTLSRDLKDRLYHVIEKQFHIDVRRGSADDESLRALRQDAFLLCRIALIRSGAASYAEQFQGMYALMRGLAAALILGASYHWGWGLAGLLSSPKLSLVASWVLLIALLAFAVLAFRDLIKKQATEGWLGRCLGERGKRERWWLWLTAGGSLLLGLTLGGQHAITFAQCGTMAGVGAGALVVAYRCNLGYLSFAKRFAASVYRDFVALSGLPVAQKKEADNP